MRRTFGPAFWVAVMSAFGPVWACSNDDNAPAPAATGGGGASPGGGNEAQAGTTTAPGGDGSGGSRPNDGTSTGEGGGPSGGGAGHDALAGAGFEGGAPPVTGGLGGLGGTAPEPDLVTSTGGPWPDSLTGACANASKPIACPEKGAAFYGQDGTYRINVPSYTRTAAGLRDSVTQLVWQLAPDAKAKTRRAAVQYCDELELGGQSDWRLPTLIEYVSILDLGFGSGYGMPPDILLETTGVQWTASPTHSAADQFFTIDDRVGAWTLAVDSTALGARCVRGPTLGGSLTVETDVVSDDRTKLVWQSNALEATLRTWEEAIAHCEGSTHAGKSDWRLPSVKELATIVDETAASATAIRAEFGGDAPPEYWSSTPAPSFGAERFALALETSLGISPSLKMTDRAAAARCVRSQP